MIKLYDEIPKLLDGDVFEPGMTPCLVKDGERHAAVLVCPGGAYGGRAWHEGAPLAAWLNAMGIHAFILHYRVSPYQYPCPQMDAARAMQLIRKNSKDWAVHEDKIGIMGFSAGGHLAACIALHHAKNDYVLKDETGSVSYKPDFFILGYPVITMGKETHGGSKRNLLGSDPDPLLVGLCSLETQVTRETPPGFIWHTADDEAVPVENSLMLASSLARFAIPFEFHVFQNGRHGLGIKYDVPPVRHWMVLCEQWLVQRGYTGRI